MILKTLGVNKNFSNKVNVVDIADSLGTNMLYLKKFVKDRLDMKSYSVNLDPRTIKRMERKGLEALLFRAEGFSLGRYKIDFFVLFEMLEHLYNPSIFFRRLAKKLTGGKIVRPVLYRRKSGVGLSYLESKIKKKVYAENVHIFGLCSEDWTKLMLHSKQECC